jgi:hypothetical protein
VSSTAYVCAAIVDRRDDVYDNLRITGDLFMTKLAGVALIGAVCVTLFVAETRADLFGGLVRAVAPTTKPAQPQPGPTTTVSVGGISVNLAAPTTQPATTQPADLAAQASAKLQQVYADIKANKLDLANTLLTQVESYKSALPQNLQTQVDTARKVLDTTKAASSAGFSLPKL